MKQFYVFKSYKSEVVLNEKLADIIIENIKITYDFNKFLYLATKQSLNPGKKKKYLISAEAITVSYTHLRAHETVLDLVCRLLLEKTNTQKPTTYTYLSPLTYRITSTANYT